MSAGIFFLCKWKSNFLVLSGLRDCPHSWAGPLSSLASFKANNDYRCVSHLNSPDVDLLSSSFAAQEPLAVTLAHGKIYEDLFISGSLLPQSPLPQI